MRTSTTFTLGFILLLGSFLITVIIIEEGDIGTIGLILTLFVIPIFILAVLNSVILNYAGKMKTVLLKRTWSIIPIALMVILSISQIRIFDADISFLGYCGLFSFGVLSFIWNHKIVN